MKATSIKVNERTNSIEIAKSDNSILVVRFEELSDIRVGRPLLIVQTNSGNSTAFYIEANNSDRIQAQALLAGLCHHAYMSKRKSYAGQFVPASKTLEEMGIHIC